MSSSNPIAQLSKIGTVFSVGMQIFKAASNPAGAVLTGLLMTGRFFAMTTLGRIALVAIVAALGYGFLKQHFVSGEAHKWEASVHKKQVVIDNKVQSVNVDTRQSQELARANTGAFDRLLAVVVDGLWRVTPQTEVPEETIDLINETRKSKGEK